MVELIKVPTRYLASCPACMAQLSFEPNDIKTDKAYNKRYIICPNCKRKVNTSEYNETDKTEYMFDRVDVDQYSEGGEIKDRRKDKVVVKKEIGFVARYKDGKSENN